MRFILPSAEKARRHARSEYWDLGKMMLLMYALVGSMNIDVMAERSEAHCFNASLSEQDLDNVGGASPRAGFRRTIPVLEKQALPSKEICTSPPGFASAGVGVSHAESSSWEAIVSSILASPPACSVKVVFSFEITYMVLLSNTCAA
jgi:hypothetical protein